MRNRKPIKLASGRRRVEEGRSNKAAIFEAFEAIGRSIGVERRIREAILVGRPRNMLVCESKDDK